jgi:hypothetical protein
MCEILIDHKFNKHFVRSQSGINLLPTSVADPGYGTFMTPGSGILDPFFPDTGYRIPLYLLLFLVPGSGMGKNQDTR